MTWIKFNLLILSLELQNTVSSDRIRVPVQEKIPSYANQESYPCLPIT